MEKTVLLSPDASRELARDLIWWTDDAREAVRGTLERLFAGWLARWEIDVHRIDDAHLVEYVMESATTVGRDGDVRTLLASLMFGGTSGTSASATANTQPTLARETSDAAWDDWTACLLGMVDPEGEGTDASRLERFLPTAEQQSSGFWSGRLELGFWLGTAWWPVTIDARAVEHLQGKPLAQAAGRPAAAVERPLQLVPVAQALALRLLPVRVELDPISLSLGQLNALAIGDVITTSHRLDAPALLHLEVRGTEGVTPSGHQEILCAAWLGQSDGHIAAELAPLHP